MASSSMWSSQSRKAQQQYELPRWHSSSMMTASIIPPPIVDTSSKSNVSRTQVLPTRSIVLEQPPATESHEAELQADLQFLLDAQAEALIRGVDGDDRSSTGSTTPTARSIGGHRTYRVDQPIRRKIGLRSARKGIYGCILSLSVIKEDELAAADRELQSKEHDLERIETWQRKKQGLEETVSQVDEGEDSTRVQRLRQEASGMQDEISRVEAHLAELKTRQRRLLKQAAAIENAVQAKLATYTSSLSLLDSDVKKFLSSKQRAPVDAPTGDVKQSVWQLPPKERTLDLAKEQINEESQELRSHLEALKVEKNALDEGASIWKDVAGRVTDFEKRLRAEMTQLAPSLTESTIAWDDTSHKERSIQLRALYDLLQELISDLDLQSQKASERGWTLLIAAIGAELDALRRGEQILAGVLKQTTNTKDSGQSERDGKQPVNAIDDLHDQPASAASSTTAKHDTDDEPDPELLFSVQEGDDD